MSKLGDRKSSSLARLVNYVSFDKTIIRVWIEPINMDALRKETKYHDELY